MDKDQVEKFAIRAALGNNGGEWATHYTAEQKEHWRKFVRDLAAAVRERMEWEDARADYYSSPSSM